MNNNHQPFFAAMESLGLPVSENYVSTPEYKLWKHGYNTAVEVANQKIIEKYKIRKTAPKIF